MNTRKPKPINSEHLGKEAEVLSESDDSEWGSTEVPDGELSDDAASGPTLIPMLLWRLEEAFGMSLPPKRTS